MSEKNIKTYDKTEIYKEKVEPLVDEISKLCEKYEIPFYFTACPKNSSDESGYQTQVIPPKSFGFALAEDHFIDHENVSNGFRSNPPRKSFNVELSDSLMDTFMGI